MITTIPVIYCSQSGKSVVVSEIISDKIILSLNRNTISNDYKNNKIHSFSIDVEELDLLSFLSFDTVIFVCSTTGDGSMPFSMKKLWKLLCYNDSSNIQSNSSNNISNLLKHKRFAVFGLGDSSFSKFNYAAKKLFNRLKQLGGTMIVRRGDGDDQDDSGYKTELDKWLPNLILQLKEYYDGIKKDENHHIQEIKQDKLESNISNEERNNNSNYRNDNHIQEIKKESLIEKKKSISTPIIHNVKIINKKYLTAEDYKYPVLELELEFINNHNINYMPSDCIGIRPINYNYREFIDYMGYDRENTVIYKYKKIKIKDTIKEDIDINCIPDQSLFARIYDFIIESKCKCSKSIDNNKVNYTLIKNKLLEINEDYDLYYNYILSSKRTFFEVCIDLGIRVCIRIIEYLPIIRYRYYTLMKKEDRYFITIRIVEYKRKFGNIKGLCSEYLRNIAEQDILGVRYVNGDIRVRKDNILFIGTGVGISVFRSFYLNSNSNFIFYYGIRDENKDFLYRDEMEARGIKIIIANSRIGEKIYVQNKFINSNKMFIDNIDKYDIVVCGNYKVSKDMVNILKKVYGREIKFQAETW